MNRPRCKYCKKPLKDKESIEKQCGKTCEEKHEKYQTKISQYFKDE